MAKKGILVLIMICSLFLIPVKFNISMHYVDTIVDNHVIEAIVPIETWNFTTGGAIHTSPAFIDINGDRNMELIFGSIDNKTYCVNSSGFEEWSFTTGGNIVASPAVADIDKDNIMDVVVASKDGYVYCLDYNGSLIWKSKISSYIVNEPVVVDLDVDGTYEILVSNSVDKLYCLDNLGNSLWNYSKSGYSGTEPTVGNIDGTPELEILLQATSELIYLDYQGVYQSSDTSIDFIVSYGMTLADLNRTGVNQLIFYESPDNLICTDAIDLSEIHFNLSDVSKGTGISTPVVANVDSDSDLEILIHTSKPGFSIFGEQGILYCIKSNGTVAWSNVNNIYGSSQPLVSDINHNGNVEIMTISGAPGIEQIYCADYQGNVVFNYFSFSSVVTNTPLVFDIDNDDYVEIIHPGLDGRLYCLDLTNISSSGKTYWSREKCSTFNTNHIDIDGDHIDDLSEAYLGTNPNLYDTDSDLLSDWEEIYCYRTAPTLIDTDDDQLTDYEETNIYGTNPINADSDSDGIDDHEELHLGIDGYETDPLNPDTDADGYLDGAEIIAGTDPTDPDDYPTSTPTESTSFIAGFILISLFGATLTTFVLIQKRRA